MAGPTAVRIHQSAAAATDLETFSAGPFDRSQLNYQLLSIRDDHTLMEMWLVPAELAEY